LADSIVAKINKELDDPKVLKRILDQSVADVESTFTLLFQCFNYILIFGYYRNPFTSQIDLVVAVKRRKRQRLYHTSVLAGQERMTDTELEIVNS